MSMKGGKVTDSGHRINMTNDQMTDFGNLYAQAARDIMTDTGLTGEQKHDLIKKMPNMKDFGFYQFLKTQFRTGMEISQYIYDNLSDKRKAKLDYQSMKPNRSDGKKPTKPKRILGKNRR